MLRKSDGFNALIAAHQAMNEYNESFSIGAGLASFMIQAVRQGDATAAPLETDYKFDQKPRYQEFLDEHGAALERLGIQPRQKVGQSGQFIGGPDGTMGDAKIELAIDDPRRFQGSLQGLNFTEFQSLGIKRIVTELIKGSTALITEEGLRSMDAARKHDVPLIEAGQIAALGGVVAELKRLDLAEEVKPLEELLLASQGGVLGELTLLKRGQAFLPPTAQEFGPGTWLIDSTPSFFKGKWDTLCNHTVELCLDNPAAADLVKRAVDNLLDCVDASRKFLDESERPYIQENKGSYLDTLQGAETYLRGLRLVGL